MRDVEITLTFTDENGTSRPYTLRLQTPRNGSPEGEGRVAHHLFSELRVAMRETQLRGDKVEKGLESKRSAGVLSQSDFDAITAALDLPKNTPHGDRALTYRRRLAHHLHPSVDYAIFSSDLESREGEVTTDATGRVTSRQYAIRARPPLQYRFQDLHASLMEYLDAVVAMLQKLGAIEILRR
jgi:hypothetical protein